MQLQTDYKFERALNLSFGIFAILLLTGVVFLTVFNVSPADTLNAMQYAIIEDGYYPILTIFVLFIPAVIPLLLLKMVCIFIFNTIFVKNGEPKIPYFYKLRW